VLLVPVLAIGVLFVAGHAATSLHIRLVTTRCDGGGPCLPAGEVLFDKTFTNINFVRSVQDAMNTAPLAGMGDCLPDDQYYVTFAFMVAGSRVIQWYAGLQGCDDSKATLGVVPAMGFAGNPYPIPFDYVDIDFVKLHGQYLFVALHHDIGLPLQS
jgi:hypothetical protein